MVLICIFTEPEEGKRSVRNRRKRVINDFVETPKQARRRGKVEPEPEVPIQSAEIESTSTEDAEKIEKPTDIQPVTENEEKSTNEEIPETVEKKRHGKRVASEPKKAKSTSTRTKKQEKIESEITEEPESTSNDKPDKPSETKKNPVKGRGKKAAAKKAEESVPTSTTTTIPVEEENTTENQASLHSEEGRILLSLYFWLYIIKKFVTFYRQTRGRFKID